MIFGIGMLFTALTISAVAAYYSIAGLVAIFSAAPIPIIVMGSALEVGKIVSTVFLHNNWKRLGLLYKSYLVPAVLILMFITSVGVFGLLSKAHSDQGLVSGDAMSKVAIFDEKIATEKDNIAQAKKAIEQMNTQVDQMMGRTDSDKGAERAVAIRKNQAKERTNLQKEITKSQTIIAQLQQERAPLAAEFRKVEAEVGPIKYIAAFIYGDNPDSNLLEKAVRWIIVLIVIVFDPLALCLILAANKQLAWVKEDKLKVKESAPNILPIEPDLSDEANSKINELDPPEPIIEVCEEVKVEIVKDIAPVNTVKEFEVTAEEEEAFQNIAPSTKNSSCPICSSDMVDVPNMGLYCSNSKCNILDDSIDEDDEPIPEGLIRLFQDGLERDKEVVVVPEAMIDTEGVTTEAFKIEDGEYVEFEGKHMHQRVLRGMRPELFALRADGDNITTTAFGTEFPKAAVTGDIFVRVDVLPNRVYKFNRNKWMEINKDQSDSYLHNNKYLEFLVDKIATGEVDIDILTETEQIMVEQFIKKSSKNG